MSRVIHVCMSHVTHMTASRHTVGPFIEGSCCGMAGDESCHVDVRVMSHVCVSHVTCVFESCHISQLKKSPKKSPEYLGFFLR